MAGYSTFAALLTAIKAPRERVSFAKGTANVTACYSPWLSSGAPLVSVAPTTAVAPIRTTLGAFGQQDGGSNPLRCVGADLLGSGMIWLVDRLSHQGSLDATLATAQTTNLPTTALTRYTNGVGVMACLEIYTAVGTTATTVSASYTNSAGTSGRTSPLVAFGGTNYSEVGRTILLPLQQGDNGVRAVASVTVTASTGTAGAFGVTLFKPLVPLVVMPGPAGLYNEQNAAIDFGGHLPEVLDGACLAVLAWPVGISQSVYGKFIFAEDP